MNENLERLKREYPELSDSVLEDALQANESNFFRASEALKAKYYSDTEGISREVPFWAPFLATLVGSDQPRSRKDDAGNGPATNSVWLAPLQDGIAQVGEGLLQAAQVVLDVLPELNFWEDEGAYGEPDGERGGGASVDSVVTASGTLTSAHAKRRGGSAASRTTVSSVRSTEHEEASAAGLGGKED